MEKQSGRCLGDTQEYTRRALSLGVVDETGRVDITQTTWVQIPAPSLPGPVTSAMSFMFINPHFLFCEMGTIIPSRVVGVLNEIVIQGP